MAELGTAEGTDEGKAEIDTLAVEYSSNEARIRAFMVASDTPVETTTATKEGQERAELYQKASVGDLIYNLANGRSGVQAGAMAESFRRSTGWQTMRFTFGNLRRKATP